MSVVNKIRTRAVITLCLSTAFITLVATGLLLYLTPYDRFQASLHTWSAVLLLPAFFLHIKNNWTAYARYFSSAKGKWIFFGTLALILPISYGLVTERAPIISLIEFGEEFRAANTVRENEYQIISMHLPDEREKTTKLSLFVKAGAHYASEPQQAVLGFTYSSVPQIAVWIETMDGRYVETLYLTSRIAKSDFRNVNPFDKTVIRRPEGLPVWGKRSGIVGSDGLRIPDHQSSTFDGVSAATPLGDHEIQFALGKLDGDKRYRLWLEVNRSYDFNAFYSRDRFPDDPIYSGSGSSGQPSLLYSAEINIDRPGHSVLSLQGRGHHSGAHGDIVSDTSNITTAKQIIDFALASVNKT